MADAAFHRMVKHFHDFGKFFHKLKEKQAKAINSASISDVVCVLPTGYGKTVILQALPFITPSRRPVIIANALNAVLEEQKQLLGKSAVRVDEKFLCELHGDCENEDVQRLKNGDESVLYILGHPEHLIDQRLKEAMIKNGLSEMISHLAVDEAHCILSWGASDFRPAYLKLGHLRAVYSNARILALTATATMSSQLDIAKALNMSDPIIITESPDRPNVFLEVQPRPATSGKDDSATQDSFTKVMDPYLTDLKMQNRNFNKTIVYVPLKWCGKLHYYAVTEYFQNHEEHKPPSISIEEIRPFTGLVAQYHAPQSQLMKKSIADAMKDTDSHLRLLFATEAYGMGVDVPDIRHVVHIGPPNNMETFVQEIGRCGRDKLPAQSTIYFNNADLAANKSHMSDNMRKYCVIKTCRREFLLQYFGFQKDEASFPCCDNCIKEKSNQMAITDVKACSTEPPTPKQQKMIRAMLSKYFDAENKKSKSKPCPAQLQTRLSDHLVDQISQNFTTYHSKEHIKSAFPYLQNTYIENIFKIVEVVKNV